MARRRPGTGSGEGESRWREIAPLGLVFALAVVVLAGLAALPAKTWFSQRAKVETAETRLGELEVETAELERQLANLDTDAEIEVRARRDFDLVYPGEESYRIVPGDS